MRSFSASFCLLAAGAAWAGSAPVSTSSVEGYFLGNPREAYLSSDLSDDFLNALKTTCASAGPLWMLGQEEPVQCAGLEYLEEAGNGPAYRVRMTAPEKSSGTSLFSIRPFGSTRWATRAPTDPERSDLKELLSGASGQSKDLLAIDSPTRAWTLFIAPSTIEVEGEFGTSNQKYLVISEVGGHYKIAGELSGSLGSLADINADGAPEIQVSRNCDGICEYVTSLYPTVEVVVSITVH